MLLCSRTPRNFKNLALPLTMSLVFRLSSYLMRILRLPRRNSKTSFMLVSMVTFLLWAESLELLMQFGRSQALGSMFIGLGKGHFFSVLQTRRPVKHYCLVLAGTLQACPCLLLPGHQTLLQAKLL
uniref:Uncharacterized protein n=1 Tax=Brassica oleracea TaxID=3712 RepID=A0A3P6FB10_BRAOL|nr:unnamed protein product [Brassica oleracea]